MKIKNVCPRLYGRYYFKYDHTEGKYKRLLHEKTQYVYRFLFADSGEVDVCINDRVERLRAGDILYLKPSERYRFILRESEFSFYNLFFDFSDSGESVSEIRSRCVFIPDFVPELSLGSTEFEDTSLFDSSRVFKGVFCEKTFEEIFGADKNDPFYDFYVSAKLRSVIADILTSQSDGRGKNDAADKIVLYIRLNYNKDVSCEAIARKFSYHANYINKLVKRKTGKSLKSYVRCVKIENAVRLISEKEYSLSEIAAALGYYDYSHFYKAFVAETGVSPSEYELKAGL